MQIRNYQTIAWVAKRQSGKTPDKYHSLKFIVSHAPGCPHKKSPCICMTTMPDVEHVEVAHLTSTTVSPEFQIKLQKKQCSGFQFEDNFGQLQNAVMYPQSKYVFMNTAQMQNEFIVDSKDILEKPLEELVVTKDYGTYAPIPENLKIRKTSEYFVKYYFKKYKPKSINTKATTDKFLNIKYTYNTETRIAVPTIVPPITPEDTNSAND